MRGVARVAKPAAAGPADQLIIDSLDTLRLLADPLRMRLMNAFADARGEPLTIKQAASQLGLRPTRLYYHVNLLEERGLLRVVSSRVVSGIIEKSYAVAARAINFDANLLRVSPAGREAGAAAVTTLMAAMSTEVADAFEIGAANPDRPDRRQMRIGKAVARLTAEAHAEFFARLNALADEFESKYGTPDEEPNRALFVAYYPLDKGTDE